MVGRRLAGGLVVVPPAASSGFLNQTRNRKPETGNKKLKARS
jgi:hypothetical protein